MRRTRLVVLLLLVGIPVVLCAAAAIISAVGNRNLRTEPASLSTLDPIDKARLAEALQLKQMLGERVWPGWGRMDIPVVLWNRDTSFLIGYPSPPPGWNPVAGDDFQGQAYYRRPTAEPKNFAVQVGDRWVASMATKWETDAFLMDAFRELLPPVLETVFPYWILVQPSEVQMTGVLHESFHVYQAEAAPDRLDQAERARDVGEAYWRADEAMHDDWTEEIDLLTEALDADSDQEASALVRQFLHQRAKRRTAHGLDEALVGHERWLEWEEGLAKYIELAIWREAYRDGDYEPLAMMASDPDFDGYSQFEERLSQELGQMRRQATREGEARFYYTGMAQAMLLDRLAPGWKQRILSEGVWLEALLAEGG